MKMMHKKKKQLNSKKAPANRLSHFHIIYENDAGEKEIAEQGKRTSKKFDSLSHYI